MVLSSAGHVADMIARMKNNRALRKNKGYYSKVDPFLTKEKHQDLKFRNASIQERRSFLKKLSLNTKKEQVIDKLWIIIAVSLFVLGAIWIARYIVY